MASIAKEPKKRMRLGTRSCRECRRRKVRCIFDGKNKTCGQCELHDTVCKAQGNTRVSTNDLRSETQNLDRSKHISDDAFQRFSPALSSNSNIHEVAYSDKAAAEVALNDRNIVTESSSAPLLEFLHEALPVAPTSWSSAANAAVPNVSGTKITLPPCPIASALVKVFQCTQPFWTVWPLAAAASKDKLSGFPDSVVDAITFVCDSLRSKNPGDVAKCLVWMTLCFQQLPKDFAKTSSAPLPLPKLKLVDLYLQRATALINEYLESGSDSLSGIEAMAIQYKCLIDLARPQQAWRCARRAIDHALILGLDRIKGTTPKDCYRQLLWATVRGADRKMALFLGLPYSIPEHLLAGDAGINSMTDESQALHKLNLICGHIIDRNRDPTSPYSVTARIAEEMDTLRAETPDVWWNLDTTDSNLPLDIIFRRRATVFLFQFMNQLLHLPYMLRAKYDDRYCYSRTTVLSSAEVMLNTWREFPCCQNMPVACDYLDFCAFNAAVVLATDLVSPGSLRPADEENRRWGVILSTAELMQRKADILGCTVPSQCAQVLNTLHAAFHGTYSASEIYEIVIPYFGKISIKNPPALATQADSDCLAAANTASNIDFDLTAFSSRLPMEFDPVLELGADWSQFSQLWTSNSLYDQCDFPQQ